MQHLSSKILAAIVACSATLLLSGMNVHASATQTKQPLTANDTRPVNSKKLEVNRPSTQKLQVANVKVQSNHHFTYQNLKAVKANRLSTLRLGSHRGRRRAKKSRARRTNRKQRSNRSRRARRSVKTRGRKAKRNQKQPRTKLFNGYRVPNEIKPREKVVNQKRSAVNRFSKRIKYVWNRRPKNFISSEQYGDSDYGRTGVSILATPSNGSLTFHRLTFIPKKLGVNQFYSPQGLVVAGHYAYVITNATNSYEASHNDDSDSNRQAPASYVDGDNSTGTSPYKKGASQIIRIDLSHHVTDYNNNLKAARHNIKVGPVFSGGHGQGLAYNPKANQLWLLDNTQGQVNKSAVSLINLRTLVPDLRINFHFGNTTIGDDLAFNRKGTALNVTEAGSDSFAKNGSLKLFSGAINAKGKRKGIHMSLIKQALRWAPSDVIQGLTYNVRNNRFYILGDDSVMSIPANRLGRLKKSDVWYTPFKTTREFEGLSFDKKGNGYLLVSRSPEILRANYKPGLKF